MGALRSQKSINILPTVKTMFRISIFIKTLMNFPIYDIYLQNVEKKVVRQMWE